MSPDGVDLKGIREVAECMNLLENLQAALPQEEAESAQIRGLDARLSASLRKALGLE